MQKLWNENTKIRECEEKLRFTSWTPSGTDHELEVTSTNKKRRYISRSTRSHRTFRFWTELSSEWTRSRAAHVRQFRVGPLLRFVSSSRKQTTVHTATYEMNSTNFLSDVQYNVMILQLSAYVCVSYANDRTALTELTTHAVSSGPLTLWRWGELSQTSKSNALNTCIAK